MEQHIEISTQPNDDVQSVTLRYDSPCNQAFSCIQDFLEQDEHVAADGSSLSFGELLAYHAKASELASLLKEDSPALTFKWNLTTQHGTLSPSDEGLPGDSEEGSPSVSEEPSSSQHPVYPLDKEFCLNSDDHASESFCNRVVLTSRLKGARDLNSMPSKVLDVSVFRNLASKSLSILETENTGEADDEMGTHGFKPHHPSRRLEALKLRKDMTIGKTRFHEYSDRSLGKSRFNEQHVDSGIDKIEHLHMYVNLNDMLLGCARAVGSGNTKSAMEIAYKVKQHASPYGNGAERLAYYFVEALHARFSGTAWPIYTGGLNLQRPSIREVLKATFMYLASCPFAKASYVFANQTILKVAKRASTLHIIEHQITNSRYPSLFKELAAQPGGPPKVHVVGLVVPHYSMLPAQRDVFFDELEKIGHQLSKYAAFFGVPFRFTPWVGMRKTIRLQDFVSPERNPDEVLVSISACFVRFVMDDMLDPRPVRIRNLKMLHDMNPDVYIQGIITGSYGTPFYSTRFKEALFHFSSLYDLLDTFIDRESAVRVIFESEVLGKAILNVVACEGLSVLGRVDTYTQWQATTEEVGMQQLPIDGDIRGKVEDVLKNWHKEYTIAEDRQYLLMGWKGRILYAMSTWK